MRATPAAIVTALTRAVDQRRLLVYSTQPEEQAELATTPLSGLVHRGRGPYTGLVINNAAGSKMDFYLARALRYDQGACTGSRRSSTTAPT